MSAEMEEGVASSVTEGEIIGIQFGLASQQEIRASSISDCPISHASQLANPFLGLPLETGKCESCGTAEPGKCEGHFGYIELPIPVYHPAHVSELKRLLSMVCLKCLKMKTNKVPVKNGGVMERLLSVCCEEACHISIKESKNSDGASFLELKIPGRSRAQEGSWNFLERFGYRYGDGSSRTLLASEVAMMLKRLPGETRRKLAKKGYFPQDGYILRCLPVPPNCLSVPDVSDGVSVMSSDLCSAMLKKVLRQIEIIRSSRSGEPNFESHEVEANDLQIAVTNYLDVRGTGKAARDRDNRYGVCKEASSSSTKAWLEKMRTLFISKGSGFSSRSVITGDAFRPVNEVGIPSEIAQKMTFEERVNVHNIEFLQRLVDQNLCLTFKDGSATYSLREGSKGHTFLRIGQVVHRRIMDGDIVFINRPPTTHKHSLQALRVYIHDDHVVKINPLMCGPLAADFDGDCVHLFYPQSLSARAEVLELFSVDKQLLSSHSGNLNLQLATDALLSLKTVFKVYFLDKPAAQQLAMHASTPLPCPAVLKACSSGPRWSALQVLQTALPPQFECHGERLLIRGGEVVKLDFNRDVIASIINDILTSLFFNKSPQEALKFFDSLQPLLMENLFAEGFSVSLQDFHVPLSELESIQIAIQEKISPLLFQLRASFNELVQLQYEENVKDLKKPVAGFILRSSALGSLIDSKSDSAIEKIVQQIGFLGLQLSDKRKFYSRGLVEEVASLFKTKNPFASLYPSEEFGLVKSCFFRGLDPFEGMVHSIATREVIVRSSKGLAEPGTLFKNLMAVLRDVVICYDGSVRNVSSNSVIQFDYGLEGVPSQSLFPAGEPVGVLAATAMSNPAYKAVLDSSPNSNSSWDLMKEILFCRVNFINDTNGRRVILYLNDCGCGKRYCMENSSFVVKNHLKKVSLRDAAVEFSIEYKRPKAEPGSLDIEAGLVGHIHLNATLLKECNISMPEILRKCEGELNFRRKKKKYGYCFRRIELAISECSFLQKSGSRCTGMPCLKFFWQDLSDQHLEKVSYIMVDVICPVLLDTVIKGDPRISAVNIVWVSPGTTSWVQSPFSSGKGELGVEVTLEKTAVRQSGDAWRIVLDCCLPVFHLIDAKRSIPYAIKQIQDLFGISCAFDQAVQRLSTSVTMVTRGVLKEHLILLASSMTCSGNLVGFNKGGIKALCRALSAQVPFTEATLYTPRKCFERASEKCHVDALAGIVASCSWGKRVAVGTGAKFDLLWDTKEIGTSEKPIDVYNFLHLVRSSDGEELDTGGLGEDVDKFGFEDAYMEPALSPDQENKAVFEDAIELGVDSQEQGGGDSSWDALPSSAKGWDAGTSSAEGNGWANWGTKKDQTQPQDSSKSDRWDALPSSGKGLDTGSGSAEGNGWADWGSKKVQSLPEDLSKPGSWGAARSNSETESKSQPSWTNNSSQNDHLQKDNDGQKSWDKPTKSSWKNNNDSGAGWGTTKVGSGPWGSPKEESLSQSSWEPKKNSSGSADGWRSGSAENGCGVDGGWGSAGVNKNSGSGSWSSNKEETPAKTSWGQKKNGSGSADGWRSDNTENDSGAGGGSSAGKTQNSSGVDGGWGSAGINQQAGSGSWGSQNEETQVKTSWGQKRNNSGSADGWKSDNAQNSSGAGGGWSSGKGRSTTGNGWGSAKVNEQAGSGLGNSRNEASQHQSSWEQQKNSSTSAGGWNSDKPHNVSGSESWDLNKDERKSTTSWGQPSSSVGKNSTQSSVEWGSNTSSQPVYSSGWGSGKPATGSIDKRHGEGGSSGWDSKNQERKSQSSWGQHKDSNERGSFQNGGKWSNQAGEANDIGGSKSWGSSQEGNSSQSTWGKPRNTTIESSEHIAAGWGSQKPVQPGSAPSWGSEKSESGISSKVNEEDGAWESKGGKTKSQSSWGQPTQSTWKSSATPDQSDNSSGWASGKNDPGSSDKVQEVDPSGDWGSKSGDKNCQSAWGQLKQSGNSSNWGTQKADTSGSDVMHEDKSGAWDCKSGEKKTQFSWGQSSPMSSPIADGWGSNKSNQPGNSSGWGSGMAGSDSDKKRPEGGCGWGSSNSGEWKSRRNRPPRQPGANEDLGNVPLTATRKPMHIFSEEEKGVLSEVDSIMLSIRRITHQSGYIDGDPLPSEDQSFVIDNVLNYHPDKAAKTGAGIDYITVKKHNNFQDTRCFFIVTIDGQSEDFSYIKCMENFVKAKFPSIAESFNSKYFRKQRTGGNQQPGGSQPAGGSQEGPQSQ